MFVVVRRCGLAAAFMVGFLLMVTWSGVATSAAEAVAVERASAYPGEFPAFTLEAPKSFKTAEAWVAGDTSLTPVQARAQVARMTHEGFKELLAEFFDDAQGPGDGLSFVMQLGSLHRREPNSRQRFATRTATLLTFRVSTIPGAVGFGGSGGENIVFADGTFLYLVGNAWAARSTHNPRHAALIAATTKLYQRVHGHPAA